MKSAEAGEKTKLQLIYKDISSHQTTLEAANTTLRSLVLIRAFSIIIRARIRLTGRSSISINIGLNTDKKPRDYYEDDDSFSDLHVSQ